MGFASEERAQIVEAKLVEKRTFLHLEPQEIDLGNCSLPVHPLRRTKSDSCVLYGVDETESDDDSTIASSPKLSVCNDPLDLPPNSDIDCSVSSQSSDAGETGGLSDDGEAALQEPRELSQPVFAETQNISNTVPISSFIHPQQESVYCYVASPDSSVCETSNGQSNMLASSQGMFETSAAASIKALQWEAQAKSLRAEALRLRAAALKLEAAAQVSSPCPSNEFQAILDGLVPQTTATTPAMMQACSFAFVPLLQMAPVRQQEQTTLMLRNVPNDYTRKMFLELLDSKGLAGAYDFVYLPIDFDKMNGLGYGFVNFVSGPAAEFARLQLRGFHEWKVQSQKVCQVCWGEPLQGLVAHIERYRSSPVMHRDVPDECKPIILQDGVRVPFPPPTRRIRAPRSTNNGRTVDA